MLSLGWARAGDCFLFKNPCQPFSATCTKGARSRSARVGQRCSKSASLQRRLSHIAARGRAARGRELRAAALRVDPEPEWQCKRCIVLWGGVGVGADWACGRLVENHAQQPHAPLYPGPWEVGSTNTNLQRDIPLQTYTSSEKVMNCSRCFSFSDPQTPAGQHLKQVGS